MTELSDYLSAVTRRTYLANAGLPETPAPDPGGLFAEAEVRREVAAMAEADDPMVRERARRRLLARGGGFLSLQVRELVERARDRRLTAVVRADGAEHRFNAVSQVLGTMADAGARARLGEAWWAVAGTLVPDLEAIWAERQRAARGLGYPSYAAAYSEWKGIDRAEVIRLATATLAATEADYHRELAHFGPVQVGAEGPYRHCDISRIFRGEAWDGDFPADALLPVVMAGAHGLGVDLAGLPGVHLDLEPRPGKSARPYCAAVRAPGEVHLVARPTAGHRGYEEVLHEAGHVAHFALADPALPWELRHLQDDTVAEAQAYLFAGLMCSPEFAVRVLGMTDDKAVEYARYARFLECYLVRRYCAKSLFELGGTPEPARYRALLRSATAIEVPAAAAMTETEGGLYAVQYLLAWFLAAHLREQLTATFGPAWFESAGAFLRPLWTRSCAHRPSTLLAELGVAAFDWRPLAAELAVCPTPQEAP